MSTVLQFRHPELEEIIRKSRLAAIEVLLADPDTLSAPLESELYVYRDVLNGVPDPYPKKPPQ